MSARTSSQSLSSRQKAAVMIVAMGPDVAGKVLRHLDEEEVEQITLEIARMGKISPEVRESIIEEFHELCVAQEY
ncbi:MAG: flagellar motor switch protein FliG, partial [bacterium]|nr:flagellar motor switch protein FliG [bacterium]